MQLYTKRGVAYVCERARVPRGLGSNEVCPVMQKFTDPQCSNRTGGLSAPRSRAGKKINESQRTQTAALM